STRSCSGSGVAVGATVGVGVGVATGRGVDATSVGWRVAVGSAVGVAVAGSSVAVAVGDGSTGAGSSVEVALGSGGGVAVGSSPPPHAARSITNANAAISARYIPRIEILSFVLPRNRLPRATFRHQVSIDSQSTTRDDTE